MRISDGDSIAPGSHGGAKSRGVGGQRPTKNAATDLVWFPETSRYKRLSDPITGGMGVVFKALDINLDVEVAIKRIRPEFAKDAGLINRFEREAKTQRKLRHPNLVQVLDYANDQLGPYIVMDWIEGRSLAEAIGSDVVMPWQHAAILISKIADALQVAHDAGVIHRDVKPSNILLNAAGEPFITDFGPARIETTQSVISETATNGILGTPDYSSPEQKKNPRNVCFQSDIWSLGATLYKVLTTYDMTYFRESLIPEELRSVVLTATEHDIAARYRSMRLMGEALIAASANKGIVQRRPDAGTDTSVKSGGEPDGPAVTLRQAKDPKSTITAMQPSQGTTNGAKAEATAPPENSHQAPPLEKNRTPSNPTGSLTGASPVKRNSDPPVNRHAGKPQAKTRRSFVGLAGIGLAAGFAWMLKSRVDKQEQPILFSSAPAEVTPATVEVTPALAEVPLAEVPPSPAWLVAPFDVNQAVAAQEAWAKHLGIAAEVTNGAGMKFRVIPPGTFDMGSPASEPNRSKNETLHKVTITQPKLLGVYPVTQGEWTKLMGSNPSHFKTVIGQDTSRFPVDNVSWDDCQEFLKRLNEKQAIKGWRYRLPTEAEWEYACRGGSVTPFWFGTALNGKQANCDGNYPYPDDTTKGPDLQRPSAVGSYAANAFGFYDMHGNVWEWCLDWYGSDYHGSSAASDPPGATTGSYRVLRGGSWFYDAAYCRSAYRDTIVPTFRTNDFGFRLALSPSDK